MGRFIAGADRAQTTLFPARVGDWIDEENTVRVVDAFVDARDLLGLGFGAQLPALHPADAGLQAGNTDREQVWRTAANLNSRQQENGDRRLPGCHFEQPAAFALVMEQQHDFVLFEK
jgi:hypothetical protein